VATSGKLRQALEEAKAAEAAPLRHSQHSSKRKLDAEPLRLLMVVERTRCEQHVVCTG
jgi:hypothetical protein